MQASIDRALSGRSASCSFSALACSSQGQQFGRSVGPARRYAAAVAAAARPSRSANKAQGPPARKASSGGKVKQAPPPAPQRAKQPPKRPSTNGDADRSGSAPRPASSSTRLPRPAAAESSISTPSSATASTPGWLSLGGHRQDVPVSSSTATAVPSASTRLPRPGMNTQRDWTGSPAPGTTGARSGGDGFLEPQPVAVSSAPEVAPSPGGGSGDPDATDGDGFLLDDTFASDDGGQGTESDDGEVFPEIQLSLPNPTKVKVKAAEYLQSCVTVSECPPPRFPEFAVIGRSNVGKSSLINMMTARRDLALVSKEPGKTKCINHFLINDSWYLVDLPGYGFAKVGLQGRQQFETFTREYFTTRANLAMVLLLVDASIPPQPIDLGYANWLTDNEVPFTLVFTKADKRRKGLTNAIRDSHVTAFKRALLQDLAYLPPTILTSAAKGLGRGELLNFIASLRVAYEKSGRLEAIRQGML